MTRMFGQPLRRREDIALLTGTGAFLADLIKPGMAVMRVIRSPYAHAVVRGIDASAARFQPGFIGLLTAADLPPDIGVLPCVDALPGALPVYQTVLARGVVRYVGEPVAILVADDAYRAEDLAELVAVAYDPLPPVLDADAATHPDSPLLYPALGSNVAQDVRQEVGDPNAAFAQATSILTETFPIHRVAASPLETRGAIASIEPDTGRILLRCSTQVPQVLRDTIVAALGIPPATLRVVSPHIGGGFGAKEAIYPEDILAVLALREFGRAVYWVEDRAEHFQTTVHGRQQRIDVRAALDGNGVVTAIDVESLSDIGAAYALVANSPGAAVCAMRGPYRIPNFRARALSVVTNKTPLNVYRGAGHPQAVLAMERIMDLAAHRLGLDRAEIRRRNMLQPEEFPVDRGVRYLGDGAIVLDSGDYPRCLDHTLEAIDYAGFPARRAAHETAHENRRLGLGLSFMVEMTATGPYEPARLRAKADGRVQLLSGITAIGQGTETTLAQILSDHLGMPMHRIEVLGGDTDHSADSPGTYASRGATMGGNAAALAGTAFMAEARALAAELLDAPLDALDWSDGDIVWRGGMNAPMSLRELVRSAEAAGLDPLSRLDVATRFEMSAIAYANGCHAAVVEIDVETGVVRVLDYAVTHDCGRIANPLLVEGQIMGGVMQGIGSTLFETLTFDGQGEPEMRGFWDYILPTAAIAPRFILRHLETPSPLNPLGMKGAGEGGLTGTPAALVNAIADALRPHGVAPMGSGPFTPPAVRQLLRQAAQAAFGHPHDQIQGDLLA
jgi:carbon-monoxide dehydrogenase large subunit